VRGFALKVNFISQSLIKGIKLCLLRIKKRKQEKARKNVRDRVLVFRNFKEEIQEQPLKSVVGLELKGKAGGRQILRRWLWICYFERCTS
jgi:hypothetical protein